MNVFFGWLITAVGVFCILRSNRMFARIDSSAADTSDAEYEAMLRRAMRRFAFGVFAALLGVALIGMRSGDAIC